MVYLIDDDKSVGRAFKLFFKASKIDFKIFESADDFSSTVKPALNDTIVLDLNLHGMNGCELLDKLKRENIETPVIVVTASEDEQTKQKCKDYGVKAYLRKPVDGEALIDIIKF